MNRTFTSISYVAGIALVASLAGCSAPGAPRVDRNFGAAVQALRAQQTLNPNAGQTGDEVRGIDGEVGVTIIQKTYQSSFSGRGGNSSEAGNTGSGSNSILNSSSR